MLVWQLMHAHSGVEKGMKKGGKPIEIMGMMVGRIDTDNENTVLVTDVRHRSSVLLAPASTVTLTIGGGGARVLTLARLPQAFALPIEGTETAVLAGTTEVDNFMIQAVDALDLVRGSGHGAPAARARMPVTT